MNTVGQYSNHQQRANLVAIILALLVFIRIRPYYLWSIEDTIRPISAILIMFISVFNFSKERYSYIIFSMLALAYIWASAIIDGSDMITVMNFIAFAFIPLIKKKLVLETYPYFKLFFCIFLALSIANYLLSLVGLNINLGTLQYENGPQTITFIKQPFYIQLMQQGGVLPRFNGLYDEPGVIGTITGLILICERMNFSNKLNKILLVAGILSMSFYFYISVFVGLVLFSQNIKHKWRWMIIIFIISAISYNISQVYEMIWSRFEWNAEAGTFMGDNRQDVTFMNFWDSIKGTPFMITGVGDRVLGNNVGTSASLLVVIAKHGLIFVVLALGALILLSYREIKSKTTWLMFCLFLILTLYQRPGFYSTYSLALYTMVIYRFSSNLTGTKNE